MYNLFCENCGKPFQSKSSSQKFCCKDCYREYINKQKGTGSLSGPKKREKVEVVCAYCGKHEWVCPSRASKYLCCSVDCLSKYNSKRYSKKTSHVCPVCGRTYYCVESKLKHHRTCGREECRKRWLSMIRSGSNNARYRSVEERVKDSARGRSKDLHRHIVKEYFGFGSLRELPKNYDIHHKDGNHKNNEVTNLVLLPRAAHMLIHRYFGNILISALHTGKMTREQFFSLCNKDQKEFYEQIIDLDITKQVVIKQGELLESLEEDNQQPSKYRNIYVGSETNSRVLTDERVEDGNTDTSALPTSSEASSEASSEDIVQTACITDNKDEDADA